MTTPIDAPDLPSAPRRIQSLEVGFSLVREIEQAQHGLSLKEVSTRAGMPRSKAHLYLSTFLGLELVARDSAGRYVLGPYALQLGLAALRQSNVVDASEEVVRQLQAEIGHSVHISIWGNRGPTIVRKLDGNLHVPMSIQVGYTLPLLSSATGHIFLAYKAPAFTQAIINAENPGCTHSTPTIAELIATTKAAGVATTKGRMYDGFVALSAPIWNHQHELCAALTIVDTALSLSLDLNATTTKLVKKAAEAISAKLGFAQ